MLIEIKESILKDIIDPKSNIRIRFKEAILTISKGLLQDTVIREKINLWIQTVLINNVSAHRNEIGNIIIEKVKKWDSQTITQKLELEVGKDLQYIRINGTVIGGVVGLIIYIISFLF